MRLAYSETVPSTGFRGGLRDGYANIIYFFKCKHHSSDAIYWVLYIATQAHGVASYLEIYAHSIIKKYFSRQVHAKNRLLINQL